jgi:hypothetical protein
MAHCFFFKKHYITQELMSMSTEICVANVRFCDRFCDAVCSDKADSQQTCVTDII